MKRAPRRLQRKRTKGWRKPKGAVCVTRPGKWGNPYTLSDYNIVNADDTPAPRAVQLEQSRAMAVRDFEAALGAGLLDFSEADVRRELRGRDLLCWCNPGDACHADVLLRISNEGP